MLEAMKWELVESLAAVLVNGPAVGFLKVQFKSPKLEEGGHGGEANCQRARITTQESQIVDVATKKVAVITVKQTRKVGSRMSRIVIGAIDNRSS